MTHSPSYLPKHVAIIMDGNGRWAKQRLLPRVEGHRQGLKALNRIVEASAKNGIKTLTVFAFSSENWKRPAKEVSFLMTLFANSLLQWQAPLKEAGVRLIVIGNKTQFNASVQEAIDETQKITAAGERMTLYVAANYGGRWDVEQACQQCLDKKEALTSENINKHLTTFQAGEVDLMIRTGGESRISNFLLWQSAYAELYFSETLWPDFSESDLLEALAWYAKRERRFGMISEQIKAGEV